MAWERILLNPKTAGAVKKLFGKHKKVSDTITSVKPAKNLTARRKTQDEMVDLVNKQYKTTGVRPGQSGSKIKREAAAKASKIHTRYEKLQKILDKK